MTAEANQKMKQAYYDEAIRYMSNAKETLKKAGKEGNRYLDNKYVKTACGTAYNAILKALDGYLLAKGIEKKKGRKSIEYYEENIARLDKKLHADLDDAYNILHLSGYYDGVTNVKVIQAGFEVAYRIIGRIAP